MLIRSVDDYQFVVRQVVPDRTDKADGFTVVDGRGIDATALELI